MNKNKETRFGAMTTASVLREKRLVCLSVKQK